MNINILYKGLLTLLIISAPISSYAVDCNSQSPALIKDGDKYYNLINTDPLSRSQNKAVTKLSSLIKGRWNGNGSTTVCKGTINNSKKDIEKLNLEANITKSSDGKLSLSFSINNLTKTSKKDETLNFFGQKNVHEIISINDNSMQLSSKYRRKGGIKNAAIMIEEITDISASNNSLTVTTTVYINGYFSNEIERKLHR